MKRLMMVATVLVILVVIVGCADPAPPCAPTSTPCWATPGKHQPEEVCRCPGGVTT